MIAFSTFVAAALAALAPGLVPMPADALLKCQPQGEGRAVVVDGVPVWTGADFDDLSPDQMDKWTGGWDEVANMQIVCAPDLARMNVQAGVGMYVLTHASGVRHMYDGLREIHALQMQYREANGEWAPSLEALGVSPGHPDVTLHLEVRADGVGWTARGTHALSLWRCEVYSMARWGMGTPDRPQCTPIDPDDPAYPDFPRIAADARDRG